MRRLAVPRVLKFYNWWKSIYRCRNTSNDIHNHETCLFEDLMNYNGLVLKVLSFMIYNGNWSEWRNVVWNYTRTQVLFQTKIAPLKFNYYLITAILKKGRNQSVLIFGLIARLLKSASKKGCTSHFAAETELMQHRAKWCDLKQKWRGFRKWMSRLRTDVI